MPPQFFWVWLCGSLLSTEVQPSVLGYGNGFWVSNWPRSIQIKTHTHTQTNEQSDYYIPTTLHVARDNKEETAILNTITINNPKEMIGVTDKYLTYFWKQDGDCKIRRAQKQLKQPRIEIRKLKQVQNDSKNNIIQKNRWNKQLPRRKNDQ